MQPEVLELVRLVAMIYTVQARGTHKSTFMAIIIVEKQVIVMQGKRHSIPSDKRTKTKYWQKDLTIEGDGVMFSQKARSNLNAMLDLFGSP
jgi:hypothetical protein